MPGHGKVEEAWVNIVDREGCDGDCSDSYHSADPCLLLSPPASKRSATAQPTARMLADELSDGYGSA